jgi:TolA-binding protein
MDDRVSSVRAAPPGDPSRTELLELGSEVAARLDEARLSDDRIARVRARIARGEPSDFLKNEPKRRLRIGVAASALALAASVVLGLGYAALHRGRSEEKTASAPPAAPPISFTVGDNAKPGETGGFIAAKSETPVKFSDGSELRLAPASSVRVTQVANNGARVLVENGSLHVSVVHRERTRWAIEAGPYEVKVTGTKFTVAWDAPKNALVVKMEEGSVVVGGCGLEAGTRLKNQEELVVSCSDKGHEKATSTIELPTPSASAAPEPPASVIVAKPKAPVDPTRNIVNLARSGQHAEAIAAAEANGWDDTLAVLSGPELLLLANAGRYAGRFELATAALQTTRRRFADSDSAATAAFELGRIAMDIRHQMKPAGDDFELCLRERPDGPLAREAMGRAIEARYGAGDQDRARELAKRYVAAWPEGPHAALAKRVLGVK